MRYRASELSEATEAINELPGLRYDTVLKRCVDTNMAITYLPGCVFLVKCCVLLLYLTSVAQMCVHEEVAPAQNSQFTQKFAPAPVQNSGGIIGCSLRWLMIALVVILLYTDRLLYHESVFDANGLLWSILFGFFLNQIHQADDIDKLMWGSHMHLPLNYCDVFASLLYSALSVCAVLDLGKDSVYANTLLSCALGTLAFSTVYMQPTTPREWGIVLRGFMFCTCCLLWTYAVGISGMLSLISNSTTGPVVSVTYKKNARKHTSVTLTQSAHLCTLRFFGILVLPEPFPYILAAIFVVCILICNKNIDKPPSSSLYALNTSTMARSDECRQGHHLSLSTESVGACTFSASFVHERRHKGVHAPFSPVPANLPIQVSPETSQFGSMSTAFETLTDATFIPERSSGAAGNLEVAQTTKMEAVPVIGNDILQRHLLEALRQQQSRVFSTNTTDQAHI